MHEKVDIYWKINNNNIRISHYNNYYWCHLHSLLLIQCAVHLNVGTNWTQTYNLFIIFNYLFVAFVFCCSQCAHKLQIAKHRCNAVWQQTIIFNKTQIISLNSENICHAIALFVCVYVLLADYFAAEWRKGREKRREKERKKEHFSWESSMHRFSSLVVFLKKAHICVKKYASLRTNNNFFLLLNDMCWLYHFTCPSSVVSFVNVRFVLASFFCQFSFFLYVVIPSPSLSLSLSFARLFFSVMFCIFRSIRVCYLIFQQTMSAFVTKHLIYFVDFVFLNRR